MSLESITAEWDELSKEYNKLEVGDNIVYFSLVECFKESYSLSFTCRFCDSRTRAMSIMRCWRSWNNCSKNV